MSGYSRQMLREQLAAGPYPDEDFFRLKVTGKGGSNWLNISPGELAKIIDAIDFSDDHVRIVRMWLQKPNPNEPSGEWSVWDLSQTTTLEWFEITEALELLREETGGGRYVGGTSGHLYSVPERAELA